MKRGTVSIDIQTYLDKDQTATALAKEICESLAKDISAESQTREVGQAIERLSCNKQLFFDQPEAFLEILACIRQIIKNITRQAWWGNLANENQVEIAKLFVGSAAGLFRRDLMLDKQSRNQGQKVKSGEVDAMLAASLSKEEEVLEELVIYFDTPECLELALGTVVLMLESIRSTKWWQELRDKRRKIHHLIQVMFLAFTPTYWDVFKVSADETLIDV